MTHHHVHYISLPPNDGHRAEFVGLAYHGTNVASTGFTYSRHSNMSVPPPMPPGLPSVITYLIIPDERHPLANWAEDEPSGLVARVGLFAPCSADEHKTLLETLSLGFNLPPNPSLIAAEIRDPNNTYYCLQLLRRYAMSASAAFTEHAARCDRALAKATAAQF